MTQEEGLIEAWIPECRSQHLEVEVPFTGLQLQHGGGQRQEDGSLGFADHQSTSDYVRNSVSGKEDGESNWEGQEVSSSQGRGTHTHTYYFPSLTRLLCLLHILFLIVLKEHSICILGGAWCVESGTPSQMARSRLYFTKSFRGSKEFMCYKMLIWYRSSLGPRM